MEVLRLVLMLAIFAWHILVHGYGFKDVAQNGMALTGNGACIILAPLFAPPHIASCSYPDITA